MVSVSVCYLLYQPMDEKIKTLFDWPIMLKYDVKARYLLIPRKFSCMKFFHTSVCLTNQRPRVFVSVSLYFCCCFCFVHAFSFQSYTKIALYSCNVITSLM